MKKKSIIFSRLDAGQPRPTVTTEGVFFFHQNFAPDRTKIQDIQEGLSFSPEFCSRRYQNYGTYRRVLLFHQNFVPDVTKIMGHTGGSFFFTRILFPTLPKLWDIQEGLSFHQNFVPNVTKIMAHTGGSFFFTRILSRPYQNSGHTGGSLFFTRIWSPTIPKFRTYRRVFFFNQNFEKETPFENISNLAPS